MNGFAWESARADSTRLAAGNPLQKLGELHRQVDAFPDLTGTRIGVAVAQPVELAEQEFEVPGHELVTKFRIDARALEIGIGDQSGGAHRQIPSLLPDRQQS